MGDSSSWLPVDEGWGPGPAGLLDTRLSVDCPRSEGRVPVTRCLSCDGCDAVHLRAGQGGAFVRCHPERVDESGGSGPHLSDLIRAAPGPASTTTVREIMTRQLVCVDLGTSVRTVVGLLVERGIGAVPVLDDESRPTGLVSYEELGRYLHDYGDLETTSRDIDGSDEMGDPLRLGDAPLTAADVMVPIAYWITDDAPIAAAAALLAATRAHRVPVLGPDGGLVGIVSTLDIARWLAETERYIVTRPARRGERAGRPGRRDRRRQ